MTSPPDPSAVEERFEQAKAAVSEERRRVADELAALEEFADHVDRTEPTRPQTAIAPAVEPSTGPSRDALASIRQAYESTVMAVPHYEEDYGESYVQSLAAEFGPDVAAALVGGNQFTQACKRTLLGAVSEGIERRERLVDALENEQASVAEARAVLVPLAEELLEIHRSKRANCPMGVLDGHAARLGVLAEKCDRLLGQRQSVVVDQRRSLTLPIDELDIPRYIYSDVETETSYPVLGTLADCTETVEALRDDVQSELERRSRKRAHVESQGRT